MHSTQNWFGMLRGRERNWKTEKWKGRRDVLDQSSGVEIEMNKHHGEEGEVRDQDGRARVKLFPTSPDLLAQAFLHAAIQKARLHRYTWRETELGKQWRQGKGWDGTASKRQCGLNRKLAWCSPECAAIIFSAVTHPLPVLVQTLLLHCCACLT